MERRDFLLGLGAFSLLSSKMLNAATKQSLPAEGVELVYNLKFGDSDIGTQVVKVRAHDKEDHVIIEHKIDIEVRVFFTVAYALRHKSTEVWHGTDLKSIDSNTKVNGETHLIKGEAKDSGFEIQNEDGLSLIHGNLVTLDSFWLASSMSTPRIVDTKTGDVTVPVMKSIGKNRWHMAAKFPHGNVVATMEFDGEFLVRAEVDSEGHTVTVERTAIL